MAVLCEAISVIVRVDRITAMPNGMQGFHSMVPNSTYCVDDELVRVGFMSHDDVAHFVRQLEQQGLTYLRDGAAVDLIVVDQQRGPLAPCSWIDFGHVELQDGSVAAAQLTGSTLHQILMPEGWTYNGSLSQAYGFVPTGQIDKSPTFLRRSDGVDVYLNRLTGKEVFMARRGPTERND